MFHTSIKKTAQASLAMFLLMQPVAANAQLLKELKKSVTTERPRVDLRGDGVRIRAGGEGNAAARVDQGPINGVVGVGAAAATDIRVDQRGVRTSTGAVAVGRFDGEVTTSQGSIPVHADARVEGQVDTQTTWDNNRPLPPGAPVTYQPPAAPIYEDPVNYAPVPPPVFHQPPPPIHNPLPPPPPIVHQPTPIYNPAPPPPIAYQPAPIPYLPPVSQPPPPLPEPVYDDGIEHLPSFQFPKAGQGRKLYSISFNMKRNPKNFDKDEEILLSGRRIVGVAMFAAGDPRSRVTLWLDGKKVGDDRQSTPGDRTAATKIVSANQEWYIWDVPRNQVSNKSRMKIEFWKDDPKVYAVRVFYENEVEIRTKVEIRTRTIIKKVPKRYIFDVAKLFEKQLEIIYNSTHEEDVLDGLVIAQDLATAASVSDDSDASIGVSSVARELLDYLHRDCGRELLIRAQREAYGRDGKPGVEQNYYALATYVWKLREHLNYYTNCPQYK